MPPIPQIFRSSSGLPMDPPDSSFRTTMWSQSGSWRHLWCLQPKKAPKGDFWVEKVPPKFFSYINMWNFAPFFLLAKNFSGSISSSLFSNPNAFSHAPEKNMLTLVLSFWNPTTYIILQLLSPWKFHFSWFSCEIGGAQNITLSGMGLGRGGGRNFFFLNRQTEGDL